MRFGNVATKAIGHESDVIAGGMFFERRAYRWCAESYAIVGSCRFPCSMREIDRCRTQCERWEGMYNRPLCKARLKG